MWEGSQEEPPPTWPHLPHIPSKKVTCGDTKPLGEPMSPIFPPTHGVTTLSAAEMDRDSGHSRNQAGPQQLLVPRAMGMRLKSRCPACA